MIKLLKKSKYYEILGKDNEVKYNVFKNIQIKDLPESLRNCQSEFVYYIEDSLGIVFVYISQLKCLLLPQKYNTELINLIKESKFTLDNWKLSFNKNGKEKNKYILNTYKTDYYSTIYLDEKLKTDTGKVIDSVFEEGNYTIENMDYPDEGKINFSLITNERDSYSYSPKNYIAFPEKNDPNVLYSTKKEIINLIIIVLNGNGSNYKRAYRKSK